MGPHFNIAIKLQFRSGSLRRIDRYPSSGISQAKAVRHFVGPARFGFGK
jgi:hypothetical protein